MIRSRLLLIALVFLGVFLGISIAAVLIQVDLSELKMEASLENIRWVIQGQSLHWVSTISFPLIFGLIGLLVGFISRKNLLIRKRERLARNGNIILSMVARDANISEVLRIICQSVEGELPHLKAMFFMNHQETPQIISPSIKVPPNARIIRECQKLFLRACKEGMIFKGTLQESKLSAFLIRRLEKRSLEYFCYYPVLDASGRALGIFSFFSGKSISLDLEVIQHYSRMAETALNKYWYREELKWARALADNTSRLAALGDMYRSIAHEVNNPLAIMSLISQAIRKCSRSEGEINRKRVIKYCDTMDGTIKRLETIIKGLERISDSAEDEIDQISIGEIIDESLVLFNEKFKSLGIDLRIDLEKLKEEDVIECRPNEIIQVLVSLLNNSYEAIASVKDPWIKLAIIGSENDVIFGVTDCGEGILSENRQTIFNPFFTTKGEGEGAGLGLSISKRIIEEHGGEFYLDENDSNTRFVFSIPLRRKLVRSLTFRSKVPKPASDKSVERRLYHKDKGV